MVALPWWLLAAGIVLVIIGFFLGSLTAPPTTRQTLIDPRLSDEEIARKLRSTEGSRLAGLLVLVGGVLIVVSLVWRIARIVF